MSHIQRRLAGLVCAALLSPCAIAQGLASCDFNGDGFADLAIGVPDESRAVKGLNIARAGAVHVLFGTARSGLSSVGSEFLFQGGPGIAGAAEEDDRFGYALAAGDFNGDKYCDLAVGIPGQQVGNAAGAGAVHIFYGGRDGFVTMVLGVACVNNAIWHRDSEGVRSVAEAGDRFGHALAAGDFNGDRHADLAIGIPNDDEGAANSGSVQILYGSARGIVAEDDPATAKVVEDDQIWHQDVGTISNVSEAEDHFGWSLAVGDFNHDGYADLAIGVPGESIGCGIDPAASAGPKGAGAVNVIKGSADGLSDRGNQTWHEAKPRGPNPDPNVCVPDNPLAGLMDRAESGDAFGSALAVGDFNNDGYDDLAIGVPGEDDESNPLTIKVDVGAVHIVYGSKGGPWYQGEQYWRQGTVTADGTVLDVPESGDQFGYSLAAGDLNGDGFKDLAIGVPFEDVAAPLNRADAGAMNVLYGRAGDGISAVGNQIWHQNSPDVLDTAERGDQFATSLTVGDFNGDLRIDVAIGIPGEDLTAIHAGAVAVLHGGSGGLAAVNDPGTPKVNEANQLWHQDVDGIADEQEKHDHFGGGRITP